jgi:eukaryotic-like serine/threonine-protein kinase
MSAHLTFVMPEDVRIIPVNELPNQTKDKFDYEAGDFVITYMNARNTSKVIDAACASLLKEFYTPKTLVEGIFRYSILNKLDPQETLSDSYNFLTQLRVEGFLVSTEDDVAPKKNVDLLQLGEWFKEFEVVAKLQGISDTEVYKIKKDEVFYVLKLLKTGKEFPHLIKNFLNEVAILRHLQGDTTPSLVESGEQDNKHFIIMEWCEGVSADIETAKYKNLADSNNLKKLVEITCNVLNAYASIHSQGIIHSDIHPRNILINEKGEVKIIDFGIARFESSNSVSRGGIGFYFEPEFAESVIKFLHPPVSTFLGEQYGLGSLIYQFFTGNHYLNFSFEKELLFKQILEEKPIEFSTYDIDIQPDIEKSIFKSLSKKSEERYQNVADFAFHFELIKENISSDNKELKFSASAFNERLKIKFGIGSNLLKNGLQLNPTCSVNYGATGIAYLFYKTACLENNAELLAVADVWANRAKAYLKDEEKAFFSKEIDITKETVGSISIYHSGSGVQLMQALISKAMGDNNSHYHSVLGFIVEASKPCDNLDVTLGKSSTLIGCSYLFDSVAQNPYLLSEIKKLANNTIKDIWQKVDKYPAIEIENPINYRGIAHGWAGIIYATLLWCDKSKTELPMFFFERVNQLENLGIYENEYVRWNLTNSEQNSWVGWCHGSAGYVFLWTLLYKYTQDEKYLILAEKTANHFLTTDKRNTNGSLCCGISGEAYALLNLYKTTSNEYYLKEAKTLSRQLLVNVYSPAMRNNSLYKGDIGAALLFADIEKPLESRMPFFE